VNRINRFTKDWVRSFFWPIPRKLEP
jgi:hypothetical protein